MTVDWEDFGQLYCWYEFESIPVPRIDIDRQTGIVLELLARTDVRATFFVLGMLARHRADLVKMIHAAGHEIAVHGSNHVHLSRLDRAAVTEDIRDAVHLVSDIIGVPIHGFRAPIFSVRRDNFYVLDILAELGLTYDSSIFPKKMAHYGVAGFDPEPRHYRLREGGHIVELPLTVLPWLGREWPVSGGGYLRLLPHRLLDSLVNRLHAIDRPLILYTHPYEFDSESIDVASNFPAGSAFPTWKRFAMNLKWNMFRGSFGAKTRHLLEHVAFSTCKEMADAVRRNQSASVLG